MAEEGEPVLSVKGPEWGSGRVCGGLEHSKQNGQVWDFFLEGRTNPFSEGFHVSVIPEVRVPREPTKVLQKEELTSNGYQVKFLLLSSHSSSQVNSLLSWLFSFCPPTFLLGVDPKTRWPHFKMKVWCTQGKPIKSLFIQCQWPVFIGPALGEEEKLTKLIFSEIYWFYYYTSLVMLRGWATIN